MSVNPAGIALSGDCTLIGMWEKNGIYIDISEFLGAKTAERFYVIEKMTAARNAIQRGCGDLMSNREKEFARFKQVAVIGIRKRRSEDPETAAELERLSHDPQAIPLITEIEERDTISDIKSR